MYKKLLIILLLSIIGIAKAMNDIFPEELRKSWTLTQEQQQQMSVEELNAFTEKTIEEAAQYATDQIINEKDYRVTINIFKSVLIWPYCYDKYKAEGKLMLYNIDDEQLTKEVHIMCNILEPKIISSVLSYNTYDSIQKAMILTIYRMAGHHDNLDKIKSACNEVFNALEQAGLQIGSNLSQETLNVVSILKKYTNDITIDSYKCACNRVESLYGSNIFIKNAFQ